MFIVHGSEHVYLEVANGFVQKGHNVQVLVAIEARTHTML